MPQEYDPLASVQAAGPPGTISFTYGLPDPATFPASDLQRAMSQVLDQRPELALQYGPEQGYGPLIDYLRSKIEGDEGLELERPQMMITGGSTQGIDHVCSLFARPGDVVLVEAPTYYETLQLFRDHGLVPLQVAVDSGGLVVEALAERLAVLAQRGQRARFVYIIPNFQNPSGITLAAGRRPAIIDLARQYDLLIIEDDVYRDLVYEGTVPASLFAVDGGQRVLRTGSFSKILAPGLRVGWLIGPPELVERLIGSGLRCMSGGANPLVANALANYCLDGLLEPHIAGLLPLYAERRDAMLAALADRMPRGVTWTRPTGGCFVWLSLPEPLRAADVAERAKEAKVLIPVGDPFFAETPTGQHLRLAFSYVTPEKIEEGLALLGSVIGSQI